MNLKTSRFPFLRILTVTLGVIFIVEAVVIAILWRLQIPASPAFDMLADAMALTIIVLPILIGFIAYRSMNLCVTERKQLEEKLTKAPGRDSHCWPSPPQIRT